MRRSGHHPLLFQLLFQIIRLSIHQPLVSQPLFQRTSPKVLYLRTLICMMAHRSVLLQHVRTLESRVEVVVGLLLNRAEVVVGLLLLLFVTVLPFPCQLLLQLATPPRRLDCRPHPLDPSFSWENPNPKARMIRLQVGPSVGRWPNLRFARYFQ